MFRRIVALQRIAFRDFQPHTNRFGRSQRLPLNRPHPSPHLGPSRDGRAQRARARADGARARSTDEHWSRTEHVWYVVVCKGGAARRARPRRPRAGLAGPASGRGGNWEAVSCARGSAFRLLTRPGFVNCDILRLVNCDATASAPSLQMEIKLLTTRRPRKNTLTTTTRSRELIHNECSLPLVAAGL